jgi:hypothetical protein
MLGLEYTTRHFVVGFRTSGMVADGGPGGLFSGQQSLPKERLTDYAFLAGYGIIGSKGFAEFLGGPSYSFGILRGALDSTNISAPFSPFQATTSYYEPRDFRSFGFTVEAKGALTNEEGTGGGLSLFVTKSPALLYGGFMLDLIIGLEW